MSLKISPQNRIRLEIGAKVDFTLDMVDHLAGDTVNAVTMTITDPDGEDVTDDFGAGCTESAGVLSFGLIASEVGGWYTVTFEVVCNELLPDGITARTFYPEIKFKVA